MKNEFSHFAMDPSHVLSWWCAVTNKSSAPYVELGGYYMKRIA